MQLSNKHESVLNNMSLFEKNRLVMLQQEEEMTYKAFELDNFYQNNKLNLISLKDRI